MGDTNGNDDFVNVKVEGEEEEKKEEKSDGDKMTLSKEVRNETIFYLNFDNGKMFPISSQKCDATTTFVFRFDTNSGLFSWRLPSLSSSSQYTELAIKNTPIDTRNCKIIKSYIFKDSKFSLFKIRTDNCNVFKPTGYSGIMQVEIIYIHD